MYIILVILGFVVASFGKNLDSQAAQPVRCGILPQNANQCIGNPKILNTDLSSECSKTNTQCELMTCIFRKSDWLDQGKVDQAKVQDYFTTYAKDHPEWSVAVNHVKRTCLGDNLSTQGIFLNCPAFDVVHCVLTGFLQFAKPSQWTDDEQCNAVKNHIRSCPVCPEDCFSPAIPIGSCNACTLWPASARS